VSCAAIALGRKIETGSLAGEVGVSEAVQDPTAGSRNASLHISTSGNKESTGRLEAIVQLTCAQVERMVGVAEGRTFGGFEAGKRERRYGRTVLDITPFTCALVCGEDAGQLDSSFIKDNNFDRTVSMGGTWEKMIEFVDTAWMAGIGIEVWGWAAIRV